MDQASALALLALALAAAVAAALSTYAWVHRSVPAARAFAALMLGVAAMAGAYALQLRSSDSASSVFWGNLEYLGIATIPVAWLAFALSYTGRAHALRPGMLALLAAVPLITLALVWTNDAHHLVRRDLRLEPAGSLLVPVPVRGPWFWVQAAYAYALLLAGTTLVVSFLLRGGLLARHQGSGILVGMLVPWASNALYLTRALPFPSLDPTPFAFTLTGVVVAWDLFAFRLLDLAPLARDAVLAGMRDGVVVLDSRGRIVEVNRAAESMVGHPAAAVVGRAAAATLPSWPAAFTAPAGHTAPLSGAGDGSGAAPRSSGTAATAPQAGADESTPNNHFELRVGDGSMERVYELRVTPLRDRRGRESGRVGVVRDITSRIRAEQERARLLEVQSRQAEELLRREAEAAALRQLDGLKSELLSTVSHELRTPLTVVFGYAQLLVQHARRADVARLEIDAQRILSASAQLRRLVEDLLDFDRLERGEVSLVVERLDLAAVLADTLDEFRAHPSGQHLTGSWPEGLWVEADRARIAQVVSNLVDNALHYAGGESVVLVASREGASGIGEARGTVRVEVVDGGPGIHPDDQSRIWERFYRGRGVAELNVVRGSGIGLAVVKRLVEAHRGRVGVESTPGFGARFWFELPAADAGAPDA